MKKLLGKKTIYLILSLLCTALVFSYLLVGVSPGQVVQAIRDVDYRFLLAFIILSLAGSFFRALRYQLTLLPAGYSPSLFLLFLITLVRNLFSDLLPARVGTTIYIYLATTRLNIPLQLATSSFALSFLFDILALGPLLMAVLLLSQTELPFSRLSVSLAATILLLITSLIVLWMPKFLRFAKRIAASAPLISFTTKKKLVGFSEQVSSEIILARHSGIYFPLFLLSIFVRACKYGSLYFFLLGILFPLGMSFSDANPLVSTIGILSAELAASLPVSGIAGFGAYEGAWAFTFSLLGFPDDISALTAIAHHLFTQAYGYGLGALAMLLLLLPIPNREDVSSHLFRGRLYYVARQSFLFLMTCTLVFVCMQLPSKAEDLKLEEQPLATNKRAALINFLGTLPGTVLFDSNRSGNFGIYILDKQTGNSQILIDSPFHEMYPSASYDGTQIVYARTRSLSRFAPAEVWIMNRDGTNNRKLIDSGTFPSFSADGKTVFFERDRKFAMALTLSTGKTKEIFPRKKKKFIGRSVVKPRISPDGKYIAFTSDVPDRWNAWIAPLGKGQPTRIAAGCEPTWVGSTDRLAWIKRSGAKAGSGVLQFDVLSGKNNVLIDGDAPLGHEYFPTVNPSGSHLLYSACPPDEHDHTTSAYQLHALELSSNKPQQLTFDNATNRWPSLVRDEH